jgi:hypothetical protein
LCRALHGSRNAPFGAWGRKWPRTGGFLAAQNGFQSVAGDEPPPAYPDRPQLALVDPGPDGGAADGDAKLVTRERGGLSDGDVLFCRHVVSSCYPTTDSRDKARKPLLKNPAFMEGIFGLTGCAI